MPFEEILTLELPYDVLEDNVGFSLDVGGSVAKVVYRDKRDWEGTQTHEVKTTGKLRLVSFLSMEIDSVVEYLSKHCYFKRPADGSPGVVKTTGVGCMQNREKITSGLNVVLKNSNEMDCFVKAFCYLANHVPKSKLLVQKEEEWCETAVKRIKPVFVKLREAVAAGECFVDLPDVDIDEVSSKIMDTLKFAENPEEKPYAETDDVFPCTMAMLGSAFGFYRVYADGNYNFAPITHRGGRSFLGEGSLLTGAESYDELMALAEKGDNKGVDQFYSDLLAPPSTPPATVEGGAKEEGEDDFYKRFRDDIKSMDCAVFCYGKAVNRNIKDFRREDLARALLNVSCEDIAAVSHLMALSMATRQVYIVGGFSNRPLVQKLISEEFTVRRLHSACTRIQMKKPVNFEFVRGGSHLGALGAYLDKD